MDVQSPETARGSPRSAILRYLQDDVALPPRTYTPILLILSFSAACIDVFSLPTLDVFVANNTGNLILLSLAAAQLHSAYPDLIHPAACIVSLAVSWIGSWISGNAGRYFGARNRGYLCGEFACQALLTFLIVGLYYGGVLHFADGSTEYAAIAILSLTMGSQNVVVKAMKTPPTIMTTVATGAMADLFADPRLFAGLYQNRARNERIAFVLVFFLGGTIGGLAFRYSSPQLCLLLTAVAKSLAALGFLLAGKDRTNEEKRSTAPLKMDHK